jgi:hypothetical protein
VLYDFLKMADSLASKSLTGKWNEEMIEAAGKKSLDLQGGARG